MSGERVSGERVSSASHLCWLDAILSSEEWLVCAHVLHRLERRHADKVILMHRLEGGGDSERALMSSGLARRTLHVELVTQGLGP